MIYTRNGIKIEAVTFDEFVDYGVSQGVTIIDGVPWSFEFRGWNITHLIKDAYLIPTKNNGTKEFTRNDILILGVDGGLYPVPKDKFLSRYELSR